MEMRKLKDYAPTRFMADGSYYDKRSADFAVAFIESLCHTKGVRAGKPFCLIDWQERIVRDLFGVLKPNGSRQFNTAYIEIPKKEDGRDDAGLSGLRSSRGAGKSRNRRERTGRDTGDYPSLVRQGQGEREPAARDGVAAWEIRGRRFFSVKRRRNIFLPPPVFFFLEPREKQLAFSPVRRENAHAEREKTNREGREEKAMTYEKFRETLLKRVKALVGDGCKVECIPTKGENGKTLDIVSVYREDIDTSTTDTVEKYYKKHLSGESVESILEEIRKALEEDLGLGR